MPVQNESKPKRFRKFTLDVRQIVRSRTPTNAASSIPPQRGADSLTVPTTCEQSHSTNDIPASATSIEGAASSDSSPPLWASAVRFVADSSTSTDKAFGLCKEHYEDAYAYLNRESVGPLFDKKPSNAYIERLRTYAPFITSMKGVAMAAAGADPHKIAPYVVASVFFLVEFSINTIPPNERVLVEELFVAIDSIILRWIRCEIYKMPKWSSTNNPAILTSVRILNDNMKQVYVSALRLQTVIRKACRSDTSRTVSVLLKKRMLWETDLKNLKILNEICERDVSKIEAELEFSSSIYKVLRYIKQNDDPELDHLVMREQLHLDEEAFIDTGQWFVGTHVEGLCVLPHQLDLPDTDSKDEKRPLNLWLRGTVGTGKTTLMCQAITFLRGEQALRGTEKFRVVHYYCDAKRTIAGRTGPDLITILRALCAKLARSSELALSTAQSLDSTIWKFYNTTGAGGEASSMDIPKKQWQDLFTSLIDSIEGSTIIAIDALDECSEHPQLLDFLAATQRTRTKLRFLFASRHEVSVDVYFANNTLKRVECTGDSTSEDLNTFVSGRLASLAKQSVTKDSIYFQEESGELKQQVYDALTSCASGMFKWVDIWLTILFPDDPLHQTPDETEARIEIDLIRESSSAHKSFDQLMDTYDLLWEANTMVKGASKSLTTLFHLVLSARQPLTLQQLHEARLIYAGQPCPELTELSCRSTRYMCTNFLTEDPSGALVWSHESAKEYVQQRKDSTGTMEFEQEKSDQLMFHLCCTLLQNSRHEAWINAGFDLETSQRLCVQGGTGEKILSEFRIVYDRYNRHKSSFTTYDDTTRAECRRFLLSKPFARILYPMFVRPYFAHYVAYRFSDHMHSMAAGHVGPHEVHRTIGQILGATTSAVKAVLMIVAAAEAVNIGYFLIEVMALRGLIQMDTIHMRTIASLSGKLFTPELNLIGGFEARFWAATSLGNFDTWKNAISATPELQHVDARGVSGLWPLLRYGMPKRSGLVHELITSREPTGLEFLLDIESHACGKVRSLQSFDYAQRLPIHVILEASEHDQTLLELIMRYDPHRNGPWNCLATCRRMGEYLHADISMLHVKDKMGRLPIHHAARNIHFDAIRLLLRSEYNMTGANGDHIQHPCRGRACIPRSLQLFEPNREGDLAIHAIIRECVRNGPFTQTHTDCILLMLEYEQMWRRLPNPRPEDAQPALSALLGERGSNGLTLPEICEVMLDPWSSIYFDTEELGLIGAMYARLQTDFQPAQGTKKLGKAELAALKSDFASIIR